MELLDLPSELIPQYALSLNLGQINHLCRVNKQFNELICANEHFWKMKFTHDYKFTPEYTGSWKKLYQNYNSVWSFGENDFGQLGLGDEQRRSSPTLVHQLKAKAISSGLHHTVLIDLEDNVWSFGSNYYDQLGLGDERGRSTPTQIPQPGNPSLPFKAKTASAHGCHTVLIDLNDNIWSFGRNNSGQLGLGDQRRRSTPTPTQIPYLKAKAVSTGNNHTALIDLDDNVWTFGDNDYGQLGLGDRRGRSTPTRIPGLKAKAVSAGRSHTLLIDLDDNVWSFGWNEYGQLGLGDRQDRSTPTMIPRLKAKSISTGLVYTILIDLDDNVWSFGRNGSGQLGLGDQQHRLTPTQIFGMKAKAVSAGHHTLLIDLDDNVWAFGWNEDGQLGLGDQQNRSTPTQIPQLKAKAVSAGFGHSVAIATLVI